MPEQKLCITNVNQAGITLGDMIVGETYRVQPKDEYYCKVYLHGIGGEYSFYPKSFFYGNKG